MSTSKIARMVATRWVLSQWAAEAKYVDKKKTDAGNTVYIYNEAQIAKRNKEKAERIEGLRGNIDKLRKKVKSDLKSKDMSVKLTALAVALMDSTFERIGNEDSADQGHVGVTGWDKSHITLGSGSATIKYTGKSGVDHEKKVTDGSTLTALREAYKAAEGKSGRIFDYNGGTISAKKVNEYLKEFDISAKDIRGLHANHQTLERLKAERKKGGKLPSDKKEREKILKAEFKAAVEGAAEDVGHEPSTLRSQYLVPSMEDSYLRDGTIIDDLSE